MTDLQMVFLAVGVFLFALIAAYSWWQSRGGESIDWRIPKRLKRNGKRHPYLEPLSDDVDDITPSRRGGVAQSEASTRTTQDAKLSLLRRSSNATPSSPAREGDEPKDRGTSMGASKTPGTRDVSAMSVGELEPPFGAGTEDGITVELVARIKNKAPVEQQDLLLLLREFDYRFHRSVRLFGMNLMTARWCDVEQELPSAQFVDLGLSIQLADRDGAMSSKESHDFQQMVLAFSDRHDSAFDFSMDVDDALEQAKRLDRISARFDGVAVLSVLPRSRGGFRKADVESCARDLVMSPDKSGVFLKSTGGPRDPNVLYRMTGKTDGNGKPGENMSLEHFDALQLFMTIAATREPEQVFMQLFDDANNLATWLEGRVVDRNGRAFSQRNLGGMLRQINRMERDLSQLGIQCGDAVSRKLF